MKTLLSFLGHLAIWIIIFGITYVGVAFVTWEQNPVYWSTAARGWYMGLCVVWLLIVYGQIRRDKAVKEFEERRAERNRQAGGYTARLQEALDVARNSTAKNDTERYTRYSRLLVCAV